MSKIMTLQQVSRQMLSTTANKQVANRVPAKQRVFQEDNGILVHLKGGATDTLFYRTTVALSIMGYDFYELVKAALSKKE